MVKTKDISVVVQGAIDKELTPQCCQSIRKHLPSAEIILSTWVESNINGLDYDKLIVNPDPGAAKMDTNNISSYNINRQILSTYSGIKAASRKYVLKLRSDMKLTSHKFLKYFNKYKKRDINYILARHKILTSSLYSIWGEYGIQKEKGKKHPTPYHISDWWHFGFKDDIADLFSCPLVDIDNFARYFEYNTKPHDYVIEWLNHRLWRFPPEQYLGVCYAKRLFPDLNFDNCLAYENVDNEQSEKFIINNFIMLDYKQSGILVQKEFYKNICQHLYKIPPHVFPGMYRFYIYKKLYRKYFSLFPLLYPDIQKIIYKIKNRNI